MLICEVELEKSPDVMLLQEHGSIFRDVLIVKNNFGDYFVRCMNEFTQQELLIGQIRPAASVLTELDSWFEFTYSTELITIYSAEYQMVVIDYYYPVGRQ